MFKATDISSLLNESIAGMKVDEHFQIDVISLTNFLIAHVIEDTNLFLLA